jgi:hypothetical protein
MIQFLEFCIALHLRLYVIVCLDKESTTSCCRIIDSLSYSRIHDIDDELDNRAWSVELTIVPSGISHILEESLIYIRKLEEVILALEI